MEMQADGDVLNQDQWEHHIQLPLNEAREQEVALRREEMAQATVFNQAFLSVL